MAEDFRARIIADYEKDGLDCVCGEIVEDTVANEIYFTIDAPNTPQVKATFKRKQ